MRKTHTERLAGSLQEGGDRRGQAYRPLVPPDPRDRLSDLGDGVIGVEHRAMSGPAAGEQAHPGHALLGSLEEVEALAADNRAEAADLPDRLADAIEQIGVVVDQ